MSFVITKRVWFAAMHYLPDHDGQCQNIHGHNYEVEMSFKSGALVAEGPKKGMVLDLGDIASWWKSEMESLVDHNHSGLNGVMPDAFQPPTAENIANWILTRMWERWPLHAYKVTVHETHTGSATVERDHF